MSAMSMKEKSMLSVVAMVALALIAVATWFMSAKKAWKKAASDYEKAKKTYASECRLIAQRETWTEAYDAEKAAMPALAEGDSPETTWLNKMDSIATDCRVFIRQRQAAKPVESDDVWQLPVEVNSWEGSLPALVKFLHTLENSTEGMFDVVKINIKPNAQKRGYLTGSFTLNCAYMREQ